MKDFKKFLVIGLLVFFVCVGTGQIQDQYIEQPLNPAKGLIGEGIEPVYRVVTNETNVQANVSFQITSPSGETIERCCDYLKIKDYERTFHEKVPESFMDEYGFYNITFTENEYGKSATLLYEVYPQVTKTSKLDNARINNSEDLTYSLKVYDYLLEHINKSFVQDKTIHFYRLYENGTETEILEKDLRYVNKSSQYIAVINSDNFSEGEYSYHAEIDISTSQGAENYTVHDGSTFFVKPEDLNVSNLKFYSGNMEIAVVLASGIISFFALYIGKMFGGEGDSGKWGNSLRFGFVLLGQIFISVTAFAGSEITRDMYPGLSKVFTTVLLGELFVFILVLFLWVAWRVKNTGELMNGNAESVEELV